MTVDSATALIHRDMSAMVWCVYSSSVLRLTAQTSMREENKCSKAMCFGDGRIIESANSYWWTALVSSKKALRETNERYSLQTTYSPTGLRCKTWGPNTTDGGVWLSARRHAAWSFSRGQWWGCGVGRCRFTQWPCRGQVQHYQYSSHKTYLHVHCSIDMKPEMIFLNNDHNHTGLCCLPSYHDRNWFLQMRCLCTYVSYMMCRNGIQRPFGGKESLCRVSLGVKRIVHNYNFGTIFMLLKAFKRQEWHPP